MIIGGHAGLDVKRENGVIIKKAHTRDGDEYYRIARRGISTEARMLRAMSDSGWTPELVAEHDDFIVQTDLGDTEKVQSEQIFRRNCTRMLYELRRRGIRHGDLTDRNIIVHNDRPWLIDWQEAHFIGEPALQKQPRSDSALLFKSLSFWKDAQGIADPSRVTRRWRAILVALGADTDFNLPYKGRTFLDLGCFQGDMVAMAACEGMDVEGVDYGGFRSGEDSIAIANELWASLSCKFTKVNIMDLPQSYFERCVVTMFSTWPYIVDTSGRERAEKLLETIINRALIFFFETQLYGDGPGPHFLGGDYDVRAMLQKYASSVEPIITLPVDGRNATRTTWMVKK